MTESWNDQAAAEIALASIRRHGMHVEDWAWTTIGQLRAELEHRVFFHSHERALLSAFHTPEDWYAFTTRRIIACRCGRIQELDPRFGISHDSGKNPKGLGPRGMGSVPTEVMRIASLPTGASIELLYETAYASMAPIYACMFWESTKRFCLPWPGASLPDGTT